MRLTFAIPGFSKCGTTTLCALLGEHPELFISNKKEPNFFTIHWDKGWNWYEAQYQSAKPHQRCGDGSTTYSTARLGTIARDRILEHSPDAKFIFVARNPITRLESSYREMHHNGYKFGVLPPYDLGATLDKQRNMLEDTRYWSLINVYRERVPDERIHVLFLEDLETDPHAALKECFEFLGVDPAFPLPKARRRLNTAAVKTYDSRLFRAFRRNKWTSTACRSAFWNTWLVRTGLRKPFTKPVHWSALARELVAKEVLPEAREFLAFYGKPANFWDMEFASSHHAIPCAA